MMSSDRTSTVRCCAGVKNFGAAAAALRFATAFCAASATSAGMSGITVAAPIPATRVLSASRRVRSVS